MLLSKRKEFRICHFRFFDGLHYPFPDESIDFIVTRYAFHHFPDVVNAIRQMRRILKKGAAVLISDPMRNEKDDNHMIDQFMRIKKDGHILFYSSKELDTLFIGNGFSKEKQVLTDMKFPFPKHPAYHNLYEQITEQEKSLYDITNNNGAIWIQHIQVGNTVFAKL